MSDETKNIINIALAIIALPGLLADAIALFVFFDQNKYPAILVTIIIGIGLLLFIHLVFRTNKVRFLIPLVSGILLLAVFVTLILVNFNPETNKKIQAAYHPTITPSITITSEVTPNPIQILSDRLTPQPTISSNINITEGCIPSGWKTISSNSDKGEIDVNSCWKLEDTWHFTGLLNGISFTPSNSTNNVVRGVYVEIPKLTKQFTFTININKITAEGSVAPFFFFGNYIPSDDGSLKGEFVTYFFDPTRSDVTNVGSAYLNDLLNQTPDVDAKFTNYKNYLPPNTQIILSPVDETHYSIQIGRDNDAEYIFDNILYQNGKIRLIFGTKSTPYSAIDVTVSNLDLSQFENQK